MNDIPDYEALRAHMGQISPLAERKVLPQLDRYCRDFIALSPFLVLATCDSAGRVDASPRGDPPGFVQVVDDRTLLLPDRPGNNRVDSFANVLAADGVGMIFLVPGIDETLRVNGRARLLTGSERLGALAVAGRVPRTGLLIEIEEVFFHCAKALRRAKLWDPSARVERACFPSLGRILADQLGGLTVADTEHRIETAYRDKLY